MLNNQFGVYRTNGYGSVTNTSIWTAGPTVPGGYFAAQNDRNLVVYPGGGGGAVWASNTNSGPGAVYCLEMRDDGNLIWVDSSSSIIWQSNSAVPG